MKGFFGIPHSLDVNQQSLGGTMKKAYKMRTAAELSKQMEFYSPSTVASLPEDSYPDKLPYESPLDAEPPLFNPEKARQRSHGIAEAFREYMRIEGEAVQAERDGKGLDAVLLKITLKQS